MSSNKPSTLILYANNPQKTMLHRLKRQTGMSEDDYRAMIYDASNGRTDSSRQLYKHEATQLIKSLLDPQGVNEKRQEEQARIVGQIFGISMHIGILNKDYRSDDPEEIEMNKAKISSFLKRRGSIKKDVSRQNLEELKETLKQLQTIKKKEEK